MRFICFGALILSVATPSIACEIDTPTEWLPGYSEQQASDRRQEILSDGSAVRTYLRVEMNYEKAPIVYLARVMKSDSGVTRSIYHTEIQPLKAFKGRLPAARTLIADLPNSCGGSNGDGDIQFVQQGELMVVFEGLPKRKDRPRGIDSVRMLSITSGSLLDPVQEWLQAQPDYGQASKESSD